MPSSGIGCLLCLLDLTDQCFIGFTLSKTISTCICLLLCLVVGSGQDSYKSYKFRFGELDSCSMIKVNINGGSRNGVPYYRWDRGSEKGG